MTEMTIASRGDVPETFPFQLGEPVEHRGIVVAPLFPRSDPVARYATLDDALQGGLEVTETGHEGTVPWSSPSRTPSRTRRSSTTARSSSARSKTASWT